MPLFNRIISRTHFQCTPHPYDHGLQNGYWKIKIIQRNLGLFLDQFSWSSRLLWWTFRLIIRSRWISYRWFRIKIRQSSRKLLKKNWIPQLRSYQNLILNWFRCFWYCCHHWIHLSLTLIIRLFERWCCQLRIRNWRKQIKHWSLHCFKRILTLRFRC